MGGAGTPGAAHRTVSSARIVSLLPAATEMLAALGLGDSPVRVTLECDEPPAAGREQAVVGLSTPRA